MKKFIEIMEKKLTDAEKKKREEVAKAIERDDPTMAMDKKMAIATATAKRVAEADEKDPEEYDNEGSMMKGQLRQICSANEKLMGMVKDDDNLPEWVQSKVTKATDYIRSVRDYLESEQMDEAFGRARFTSQLKKKGIDVNKMHSQNVKDAAAAKKRVATSQTDLDDYRKKTGMKKDVNELNKSTLGSYIKKAAADGPSQAKSVRGLRDMGAETAADKAAKRAKNRSAGIGTAVNKLTKEGEMVKAKSADKKPTLVTLPTGKRVVRMMPTQARVERE